MTPMDREAGSESTVFVIDDDVEIRQSLRRLLEEVNLRVEEFGSAQDFLAAHASDTPGCMVLDIRMPEMSGIELQKTMLRRNIHLPIIFVTGHADVAMAVECMKRGAFDFIEKPFRAQRLLDTIQRALEHERADRRQRAGVADATRRLLLLTAREREVVGLSAKGLNNREIAGELGVSSQSIDSHRSRAMRKLEVQNVPDLVRLMERAQD